MFPIVLGLIQALPYVVHGVEKMFGHSNGPAKKQAATTAITDIINLFSQTASTPGADSSVSAFVDTMIEATVKLFNEQGVFTHQVK